MSMSRAKEERHPALGDEAPEAKDYRASVETSSAARAHAGAERESSMLPDRRERRPLESAFVRLIATGGVVGVGVALGAILSSQNVAGWIVGLVIAVVSVTLSAILWSSRRL